MGFLLSWGSRLLGLVMPYKFLIMGAVGAAMALGLGYLHLQNRALSAEKTALSNQLSTAVKTANDNAIMISLLQQSLEKTHAVLAEEKAASEARLRKNAQTRLEMENAEDGPIARVLHVALDGLRIDKNGTAGRDKTR